MKMIGDGSVSVDEGGVAVSVGEKNVVRCVCFMCAILCMCLCLCV